MLLLQSTSAFSLRKLEGWPSHFLRKKALGTTLLFQCSPRLLEESTRVGASVLALWAYNIMRWFCLESPVVERKYVFTRFKAENDYSPTALVAGMTSKSFPREEISLNSSLRDMWKDCRKVTESLTSNSEVSNPIDSAVCGKCNLSF